MLMKLKRPKAIARMREAGRLVAETFAMLDQHIQPGISLLELDTLAEDYIRSRGAAPLYKGYKGSAANHPPFPGTICASVNEQICHGIPTKRKLKDGDVIGIDIGLRLDGWCGDACVTYAVGEVSDQTRELMEIGREALRRGIAVVRPGGYLNDIGEAIEGYADEMGVTVVHEWGGHGIGKDLHEPPSVSHIRQPGKGPRLKPGMVFTIEPMINAGTHEWQMLPDGWTVITKDRALSVQYEHTVAVTDTGVEILSLL